MPSRPGEGSSPHSRRSELLSAAATGRNEKGSARRARTRGPVGHPQRVSGILRVPETPACESGGLWALGAAATRVPSPSRTVGVRRRGLSGALPVRVLRVRAGYRTSGLQFRAGLSVPVLVPTSAVVSVEMRPARGGIRPRTHRRDSQDQAHLQWPTLAFLPPLALPPGLGARRSLSLSPDAAALLPPSVPDPMSPPPRS